MWITYVFAMPSLALWLLFLHWYSAGGLRHIDLTGFHTVFVVYLMVVTTTMWIVHYFRVEHGTRADAPAILVLGVLYHIIMPTYVVVSDYMGISPRTDAIMTGLLVLNNVRVAAEFAASPAQFSWLIFTTSVATVQCSSLMTLNLLLLRVWMYRVRFPRLLAFKSEFKPTEWSGKGGMGLVYVSFLLAVYNAVASVVVRSRIALFWLVGGLSWFGFVMMAYVDRARVRWRQLVQTFNFAFTTFVLVKFSVLNGIIFVLADRAEVADGRILEGSESDGTRFVVSLSYFSLVYAVIVCIDYFDIDHRVVKYGLVMFAVNNVFSFAKVYGKRNTVFLGGLDVWALYMATMIEFTILILRLYKCKVVDGRDFYRITCFVRPTVVLDSLESVGAAVPASDAIAMDAVARPVGKFTVESSRNHDSNDEWSTTNHHSSTGRATVSVVRSLDGAIADSSHNQYSTRRFSS
eukprot:TRINITY_DN66083_c9_g2_i1.p1 TRINITY_DN66083_c9_g2~~TRINITY_DN66083_c9_g2_i1.p1  ORF type:complete len:462 (-),score=164.79 TRINITY_DN66083_c9_g2_i1:38-1423(-)